MPFSPVSRSCPRGHLRRTLRPAIAAALTGVLLLAPACPAQVPVFEAPGPVDPGARTDRHGDLLPRLASGTGGVWVVVWQVMGSMDLGLGHDMDVLYSRTADDGAHWSSPRPISAGFTTDHDEDRAPGVATDGKGKWVVVWTSTGDLTGGSRGDRDIHYVVSSDNALTWSPVRGLNSNATEDWGDDESADIASDRKGGWVVVWESRDSLGNTKGGDRDILFAASDDGSRWSAPNVIDPAQRTDTDFDTSPRIAVDLAGAWMAAWSSGGASQETNGFRRGILVARSGDGGLTWDAPRAVAGTGEDDRPDLAPGLAGDGHDNWVCAWSSSDSLGGTIGHDRDILYVRSGDGGKTWSARAPLGRIAFEDSGDDDMPQLVVDSAGNWVLVWTSWDRRGASRGADADLLVAMSRDAGITWTDPYILNTNARDDHGEDITPSLATDDNGVWITAWSSNETLGDVRSLDRDILAAAGHFGREIAGPPRADGTF